MVREVLVETTLAPKVPDAVVIAVAVSILFANCKIADSATAFPNES